MTIPHTIELESGGAICASVVNGKVLLVVSPDALLTRAECEHVGDMLWACGVEAEPPATPRAHFVGFDAEPGRAKPITSVDDPRVRGNTECPDVPRAGDSITSAPQG